MTPYYSEVLKPQRGDLDLYVQCDGDELYVIIQHRPSHEIVGYLNAEAVGENLMRVRQSFAKKGLGQPLYAFAMMALDEYSMNLMPDDCDSVSAQAVTLWDRITKWIGVDRTQESEVPSIGIPLFDADGEPIQDALPEYCYSSYSLEPDENYVRMLMWVEPTEVLIAQAIEEFAKIHFSKGHVCNKKA